MQIKTEDYTTTININLVCPDCKGIAIVFDDDPKSYAETFLASETMAVIPWHCTNCGSGGVLHIHQAAQQVRAADGGYCDCEQKQDYPLAEMDGVCVICHRPRR